MNFLWYNKNISRNDFMDINATFLVKLAIVIYIFAIFFAESSGTLLVQLARVIVFGAIVSYAVLSVFTKSNSAARTSRISYYYVWGAVFFAYFLSQLLFGEVADKDDAQKYWLSALYTFAVNAAILYYICRNKRDFFFIIKVFIVMSFVSAIYVFIRFGFDYFFYSRITDYSNANSIAMRSAFGAVLAFLIAVNKSYTLLKKTFYYALFFLNIAMAVLCASRKPFIIILVALVIYFLLSGKSFLKSVRNFIFIVIILFGVYLAFTKIEFLYNLVGVRLESMISGFEGGDTDASTATRLRLIEEGWKDFTENPVFGYGLDGFRAIQRLYHGDMTPLYAHNNFIEILVDGGIVGFAVYYSLYLVVLVSGIKRVLGGNKNKLSVLFFGLFIAFWISEYGIVTYFNTTCQLALLLCYFALCKLEPEAAGAKAVAL